MKTHFEFYICYSSACTHFFFCYRTWPDNLLWRAGVFKMQSSVMAFFPSVATAKLELNSLYRKYVDMFGISLNNSTVGCHLTHKMAHLPVLLIDRTFFSTGTAIQSIATSYGALIRRWLLNRTSVVQVSCRMHSRECSLYTAFFQFIHAINTSLTGQFGSAR